MFLFLLPFRTIWNGKPDLSDFMGQMRPILEIKFHCSAIDTTLPSRQQHPLIFLAYFKVTFLMPRVCFKPVTWWGHFSCVTSWLLHTRRWWTLTTCLSSRGRLIALFASQKNCAEFGLIIFYLYLIYRSHADSCMTDKNHGKLSSWR